MTPEDAGSITRILGEVQSGADDAVERLLDRYWQRIIGLARARLASIPRTASDEEDVALSAFNSFCVRAARGQFPDLKDRDGLWRLVARITARKAATLVQHERRKKRGGGRILLAADLAALDPQVSSDPMEQVAGAIPEFATVMAEECQRLLNSLPDDTFRQIALGKVEGCTDEEIAKALGCTRRTVVRKLNIIRERWAMELP